MEDGNSRRVLWADPPRELVGRIVRCLNTDSDVRRFRAVCSSWRSSTSPPLETPNLKLPFPFAATGEQNSHPKHGGACLTLTHQTVYLLQSPEIKEPHCWIVKIIKLQNGKVRVLNPISDRQIKFLPETHLPKVLNTLDFRLFEVCKSYRLSYVNPSKSKLDLDVAESFKFVKKVVFSRGIVENEFVVMAIDEKDKLWYIKSGDEKWTPSPISHHLFHDVVDFKNMVYAVNRVAGAYVFDSSYKKMDWITDNIYEHASSKKCLLELFDGELCLIEVATDKDKRLCKCYDVDGCRCRFPRTPIKHTAVDIIFSRINKERNVWVQIEKLDNTRVIFVGDDCSFSIPVQEFTCCKNTRVFYTDKFIKFNTEEEKKKAHDYDYDCNYNYWAYDCYTSSGDEDDSIVPIDMFNPNDDVKVKFRGLHGHNIGVWDCDTGKIGSLLKFPEYADIFWPPPSWLSRDQYV